MPRTYQKIKAPSGFTRYMQRKFKQAVPGIKSPYRFTVWMLTKQMTKRAVKRSIAEFKRKRR